MNLRMPLLDLRAGWERPSIRSIVLLALLCWLPAPSGAAELYPSFVWPSEFQHLAELQGGIDGTITLSTEEELLDLVRDRGEARSVPLPFVFRFFGVNHTSFNVGSKGYISFGGAGGSNPGNSRDPAGLVAPSQPANVIAAWWGDQACDPEVGVRTKVLGHAPYRAFGIEWEGCVLLKRVTSGPGLPPLEMVLETKTTFQAQIWLYETTNLVRVQYGSAQVEPGPEWSYSRDWPAASWGVKGPTGGGVLGPDREGRANSCFPSAGGWGATPPCRARHFPEGTTIQYGLSAERDAAVRITGVGPVRSNGSLMELTVETALMNTGSGRLSGVGLELYLASDPRSSPGAAGTFAVHRFDAGLVLEAAETRPLSLEVSAERPSDGSYWVCALVDPDERLGEADRSNNWSCGREPILFGADLGGSIEAPAEGTSGETVTIPIVVRNLGDRSAAPFAYRISIVPENPGPELPIEILFVGSEEALDPNESRERSLELTLPALLRDSRYLFELELDPLETSGDRNRWNNVVRSSGWMIHLHPQLEISRPILDSGSLDQCLYGMSFDLSVEICNVGTASAQGFLPGLLWGAEKRFSLSSDLLLASDPPGCTSGGGSSCAGSGGGAGLCVDGTCRSPCESDSVCGGGLRCLEDPELSRVLDRAGSKSCMNFLAGGSSPREERCRSFHLGGQLPERSSEGASPHYIHLVSDAGHSSSQAHPDAVTLNADQCNAQLPELVVAAMEPIGTAVAGKVLSVRRVIENRGALIPGGASFSYRYFLASGSEVTIEQIPLDPGTNDGWSELFLGAGRRDESTDLVLIPERLPAGRYHLAVVLNPDKRIPELRYDNNTFVLADPIVIGLSALKVVSTVLPRATVGVAYRHTLIAASGTGPYRWSGEGLPEGIVLSEEGVLHGTVQQVGLYPFFVRVASANDVVDRQLVLEVVEGMSPLEVTTSLLPVGVAGWTYALWFDTETGVQEEGVRLAATGGRPPYTWELDPDVPDNFLPAGLFALTWDGYIRGILTSNASGRSFVVKVTDALGNEARRRLELEVISYDTEGYLGEFMLPLAKTGDAYSSCVGIDGYEDRGYSWEVDEGAVPAGLSWEEKGYVLCFEGVPRSCGLHRIALRIFHEPRDGTSRYASVILFVECGEVALDTSAVRPVRRGENVDFQLEAIPSSTPRYRILRGALPVGLRLDSDGRILGEVDAEADPGAHDLVIEIRDEVGRRGLGALSIRVEVLATPLAPTRAGSGCTVGSSDPATHATSLLLILLALGAGRSRAPRRGPGRLEWILLGALTALTAGIAGCDGDADSSALACGGTPCARGMSCDEAEGICKCGGPLGEACGADEFCVSDPQPVCVSASCEWVQCDRGQSCNPATGACECGTGLCEADEVCVEESCVSQASCEDAGCQGDMRCDPIEGVCRCGEMSCGAGERCVEERCIADRCMGVNCGAEEVCDPTDGVCHCGGPSGAVCRTGEACVAIGAGADCVPTTRCDEVSCGGGMVCDPNDGECRCGGVGEAFPTCSSVEVCLSGQCRGDTLCRPGGIPVVCESGSSCDPSDGLCKCGGAVCQEGEGCVITSGGSSCEKSCDPNGDKAACGEGASCIASAGAASCRDDCTYEPGAGGCRSGEHCFLNARGDTVLQFCAEEGSGVEGASCSAPSDCIRDHYCAPSGVCREICRPFVSAVRCQAIHPSFECLQFPGMIFGFCEWPND